jgi:alpha-N-arabinofuranosidase
VPDLALLAASVLSQTMIAEASYLVQPTPIAKIDRRLFGWFLERPSWGNEIGVEAAVVPGTHRLQPRVVGLMRTLNIPTIRFPGGTDIDYTDWTDMIDLPGRKDRPITIGHQKGAVSNRFGYLEFINLCDELNCEAILPVRFRDGLLGLKPLEAEANNAANLVGYVTTPDRVIGRTHPFARIRSKAGRSKPFTRAAFQIGNETWFFLDELRRRYGSNADQRYVDALGIFIAKMRAVNPKIPI